MAAGGAGTVTVGGSCLSGCLAPGPGSSPADGGRLRGCSGLWFGVLRHRLWGRCSGPRHESPAVLALSADRRAGAAVI